MKLDYVNKVSMKSKIVSQIVSALMILGVALIMLLPPTGCAQQKLIALTFDDGPSQYTEQLLDGLAERQAHVTFFMTGENGDGGTCGINNGYKDLLLRMLTEGHQLANHSYAHKNFDDLTSEEMQTELSAVDDLIKSAAGNDYECFVRVPGGHWDENIATALSGRFVVKWSLDSADWKNRDAKAVCDILVNNAKNGDIVLLHDLYPTSVEGALRAIDQLQTEGFEFVTVSELLELTNTMVEAGRPIRSADVR